MDKETYEVELVCRNCGYHEQRGKPKGQDEIFKFALIAVAEQQASVKLTQAIGESEK